MILLGIPSFASIGHVLVVTFLVIVTLVVGYFIVMGAMKR